MEPLSALALAGNVIQFIESAGKLISEARQVYQSASGITAGNRDAIAVYDDFRIVAAGLSSRTADDSTMVWLAEGCQELSDELVQRLKGLQAKHPGSKRDSLRVAWRALRDKGELESLEKRLDRYRQQLVTRINFIMSQEESSTYRLLQECKKQGENSTTRTGQELQRLHQEILNLGRTVEQHSQAAAASGNASQKLHNATLNRMGVLISDIIATRAKAEKEYRILNRLAFSGMRRRENGIGPARAGSYRWLLYPPSGSPPTESRGSSRRFSTDSEDRDIISILKDMREAALRFAASVDERSETSELHAQTRERFRSWLESGSGIFYISGKPGSGKSTMMKFLAREKRTFEGLKSWAAGNQLAFASFFFWSSGLPLQRSIEGLYRGLLWETLRTCPELIPTIFPQLWDNDSDRHTSLLSDTEFLVSELEEAFVKLTTASSDLPNLCISFFIDGLDEYGGDHWQLARLLKKWADSNPHIKFCVSSRHYSAFEHSFITQPERCLRLHEHTYQDMIRTAQDELELTGRHATLASNPDYLLLVKSAVNKANGVFLWLHLALRHLTRGIGSGFSVTQLADMLHIMPEDVSVMFQNMLDKLLTRPDRLRVAVTLLCLTDTALKRVERRSVMYFVAMDDFLDGTITPNDLLTKSLSRRYSPKQIEKHLASTETMLRGRCEDLIEIQDINKGDVPHPLRRHVEFVHRDLRDFLVQDDIAQQLYRVVGWSTEKLAGLHRWLGLVLLRTVPPTSWQSKMVDDLVDDFYYSESVSAVELELLVSLVRMNNEVNPSAASTPERYCSILALRDNIPGQSIVDNAYYGKHRQSSKLHAQRFVSAAAFHRHQEYVLGMISRYPALLQLNNGNLLLSASLGGSAALYSFAHQHKQETGRFRRMSAGDLSNALEAFATIDPFTNQGGVGTLLYARTPKPLFPTSDANQVLDMDRDPIPKPRPLRRGGADPLKLARVLLQKGASPNTRLKHLTLPSWDGSYWTPWTATLLGVAGLIRKGELLDGILLDVMELYLWHGADPTVCFVGRYLPKHKLELVPTYRVGPGVYVSAGAPDHVKNLFGEHPDRWHYITLPQLLELVAEHPKKQTVADLLYAKSPGVVSQWVSAAAASWGGRGRRPGNRPLTNISKLELAQLGTCYFFVSMIVNEQELTSVRAPDSAQARLLPARMIPI